jgi:predicted RNA methylase
MQYNTISYRTITVYYDDHLDGGGREFGQDYLRMVRQLRKRPRTVFEWCAGPGFIGFSILAHGLCDRLCLADVNPQAIAACRKTVEMNGLGDRLTVYHSDCLDSIPGEERERWDLVVGNPPHSGTDRELPWGNKIIYMDVNWVLHDRFWRTVHKFLAPLGLVLVQENSDLSTVSDFADMIEKHGMRICHVSDLMPPFTNLYYIGATRVEDMPSLRGRVFDVPAPCRRVEGAPARSW